MLGHRFRFFRQISKRSPCLSGRSTWDSLRFPLTITPFSSCGTPTSSNSRWIYSSTLRPAAQALLKTQTFSSNKQLDDDPLTLPMSNMDDRRVAIGWNSSSWSRFHNIWLRDHCRCPECFHSITKQRLLNTFEIPSDIKPASVESKPEGLEVTWPSLKPHVSLYPWSWLKENSYDPPRQAPRLVDHQHWLTEKFLWGSKIAKTPPTIPYDAVMAEDDRGLFEWLSNIDRFGFCFVSGVPVTVEATEELIRRIGFIRETQYGSFWDFTSDLSKGDTAYTTMALQAHTDTTYYTDPCGLQAFHLLSHTDGSGGQSLLVDGLYVASILKDLHSDVYEVLSSVRVPTHAAGEATAMYRPSPPSGYPILNHDPGTGELVQVRYNNDDRSAITDFDSSAVEKWYEALKTWNKLLTSADSEYWVQLTPGTVIAMDNHRVLHGRSAFDGKRRMCGAYIGVDEYRSKLAVLREKFTPKSVTGPEATLLEKDIHNGRSIWSPGL